MNIKFSVVIPAYNAEKHIEITIKSVLAQSYTAFEIIIIDDGSTDNTAKIISQISSPLIKYYYQENGGPSKARNNGTLKSLGDFIAFLDADDVWYPNHLSDANEYFKSNHNVLWFSSAYDIEYDNGKVITRNIKTKKNTLDYFESTLKTTFVNSSVIIIHHDIFSKVGGFNENWKFGEDLNLWIRIALQYPKIGYCTKSSSRYKKTIGSLTFSRANYNFRNTLSVLYFTNKEVEISNNKNAIKLINQWIEDAVYNAVLNTHNLILRYIKNRWKSRVGIITRLILYTNNYLPLILIKAIKGFNKVQRKWH